MDFLNRIKESLKELVPKVFWFGSNFKRFFFDKNLTQVKSNSFDKNKIK